MDRGPVLDPKGRSAGAEIRANGGLKGTAIRLAVRDPSCLQAPVLRELGGCGTGEELLLPVAQVTTTNTGIQRRMSADELG
jgi:hypothetical protein